MKTILIIAVGGALGAVARHFVNGQVTAWFGDGVPWGILSGARWRRPPPTSSCPCRLPSGGLFAARALVKGIAL